MNEFISPEEKNQIVSSAKDVVNKAWNFLEENSKPWYEKLADKAKDAWRWAFGPSAAEKTEIIRKAREDAARAAKTKAVNPLRH